MRTFVQKPKATQKANSAIYMIPGRAHLGQRYEMNSIFQLQRTIGNQFVQRLLARKTTYALQQRNFVARQQAVATPTYHIIYGNDFNQTLGGVNLNATLLANANNLCNHLIQNNLVNGNIVFNQGVRSPATAHLWSTAYAIRHGWVPLANLQALRNGRDLDGNLWYEQGWTQQQIVANAQTHWNGALAAEGYPVGNLHRLPNTQWASLSNHLTGNAIDIKIPWTIGAWSTQANQIVAAQGLSRPIAAESWHFQLS